MTTYKIIRFRFDDDSETIVRGLTLEQAQAHCQRDDTKGEGWFDGYEEEADDTVDDDEDDEQSTATLTGYHPFGFFDTIIVFDGVDDATGDEVTIGVDHRPAREIRWALQSEERDEPIVVAYEPWQVIRRAEVA